MVVYEHLNGRISPTHWFKDRGDGVTALKWLGLGIKPSRTAWYDFRDRIGPLMEGLNGAFVRFAEQTGYVSGKVVSQDGTFLRACASRHQLINRERLDGRLEVLEAQVQQDALGMKPASLDSEAPLPSWMARTVRGRRRQLRRFLDARQKLAVRLSQNESCPKSSQTPEKKVKISLSDPEATLGRDKEKVFCPLYTVQYVVDASARLVLAYQIYSKASDAGTLIPMLDRTREVLGFYPESAITDSGYVSILDLKDCRSRQVILYAPYQENSFTEEKKKLKPATQFGKDQFQWSPELQTYTCPAGHQMHVDKRDTVLRREEERVRQTRYRCPAIYCETCPLSAQCCRNPDTGRTIKRLEGEEYLTDHQARMQTEIAKDYRRMRGSIIELPFADLKAHRNGRKLHCRGLRRVQAEIGLHILAYNMMNIRRLDSYDVTP